jgi:hypothetical protein
MLDPILNFIMKKIFLFILCIVFIVLFFDKQLSYLKNYVYETFSCDIPIMGKGKASAAQLTDFFLKHNRNINRDFVFQLAGAYIKEASIEGVNWDVAFVQMCVETNYLRFGGQVKRDQNNFAGIGATDNGAEGAVFKSPEEGIRAQIQHLKAYACTSKLKNKLVDPRFAYVKRGSAEYVSQLGNGNWASDPNYGEKINNSIRQLSPE